MVVGAVRRPEGVSDGTADDVDEWDCSNDDYHGETDSRAEEEGDEHD
jgi:hypothetical protein